MQKELNLKLASLMLAAILIFPITNAYGHGLGFDTISDININGKEISVTIEMPLYFTESEEKQILVSATEKKGRENAKNVTYLIGLFYENEMIFRNYFFAPEGILAIQVNPTSEGEVKILGEQDDLLGAYHATESQPLELTGPVFESGGLYTFEVEIRTIDEPTNIIENQGVYRADVSIAQTTEYIQQSLEGNDIKFRMKSYFDSLSGFNYDAQEKIVTFEMPFDWSDDTISHIPVVHEEVHFPKDFAEFLTPSYTGKTNGIDLFKSSVTIDDYTEEDERIVHFVLLTDHLKFVKNQLKKSGEDIPDKIIFTLSTSQENQFPMTAFTRDEQFQIDLSWEPTEVLPGEDTTFVFTIRDGATAEPLRRSTYDFVIIQSGKEIHRINGEAEVGGGFEKFTFSEDQTGPTIVKFENIRGTGLETEFGFVVVPEFGTIAILILIVAITSGIIFSRKYSLNFRP